MTCDRALEVCVEACTSDAECRIAREDRGAPGYEGPFVDPLVYDAASTATCDAGTGRCVYGETSDDGAPCARSSECSGGVCLSPARAWDDPYAAAWCGVLDCERFTGGFCTTLGCESDGPDARCTTMPTTEAPGETRITLTAPPCESNADCREGYACTSDGACLPSPQGDLTVGDVCASDAECGSTSGVARCHPLDLWSDVPRRAGGTCTIVRCEDDDCPGGCQWLPGLAHPICLRTCDDGNACAPGHGCVDADLDPTTPRACVPVCARDDHCGGVETCQPAGAGATLGRCRPSGNTCDALPDFLAHGIPLDDGSLLFRAGGPVVETGVFTVEWTPRTAGTGRAQSPTSTDTPQCIDHVGGCLDMPMPCAFDGGELTLTSGRTIVLRSYEDIRLFPRVEHVPSGVPCDPRGFTHLCPDGETCATRDARGPTCGPRPSCDAPISLEDEAGFGAREFSVLTMLPQDPLLDAPSAFADATPLPTLVYRWTAPSRGMLHVRVGAHTSDPHAPPSARATDYMGLTDQLDARVWIHRDCDDPSSQLTSHEPDRFPLPDRLPGANVEVEAGETLFIFTNRAAPTSTYPLPTYVVMSGALIPRCAGECRAGEKMELASFCPSWMIGVRTCTEACAWDSGRCIARPLADVLCDPFAPACEPPQICSFVTDYADTFGDFECASLPNLVAEGGACRTSPSGALPERNGSDCLEGTFCFARVDGSGRFCADLCGRVAGSCGAGRECLMLDGSDEPGSPAFGACVDALTSCDPLSNDCASGTCAVSYGGSERAQGVCVDPLTSRIFPSGAPCDARGYCAAGTACHGGTCTPICALPERPGSCPPGATCSPLRALDPWGLCL